MKLTINRKGRQVTVEKIRIGFLSQDRLPESVKLKQFPKTKTVLVKLNDKGEYDLRNGEYIILVPDMQLIATSKDGGSQTVFWKERYYCRNINTNEWFHRKLKSVPGIQTVFLSNKLITDETLIKQLNSAKKYLWK